MLDEAGLSVYATGSYGRLEAWNESDIDLFFIYDDTHAFSLLTFMRLGGRLIEETEKMGFPPFSGDGKYLETIDVNEIERTLGSRDDDSTNAFTARMLLLLESQPVSDPDRYHQLISRVVGFYFRDHADHSATFIPMFLTNDILRFWRTLTLNYEHDRAKSIREASSEAELTSATAKVGLKNFKLKVSRLSTCFSMVAHLASDPVPVAANRVIDLCRMTPRERFLELSGRDSRTDELLRKIDDRYEQFLGQVQTPEVDLLEDFANADLRSVRLSEAAGYGKLIYELLKVVAPDDRLRRLVV